MIRKLLIAAVILLIGCYNNEQIVRNTEEVRSNKPPINLTMSQAFTAQSSLFVKARVEVLNNIAADDVTIIALGLDEGKIIEQQKISLSKITKLPVVKKGTKLLVPFEMPVRKISEFQLKCSWGEHSKKILDDTHAGKDLEPPVPKKPELTPSISAEDEGEAVDRRVGHKGLIIDSINVLEEPCSDCGDVNLNAKKVKINAKLKNFSEKPVSNLSLAFGLVWYPEGKIPELAKDLTAKRPGEEELSFGQANIPVGGELPFSVKLAKPLLSLPGGEFRPHIRILSYK